MISDVDETIKQVLIKKGGLALAEVDIVFDMPDREWSAAISKPTVNLYLYDIHENRDLRDYDWVTTTANGVSTKRKPPARVDLSYLITVWTNDTADQHRLLGHILATLLRYSELPDDLLQGSLAGLQWPLRTATAQPDGVLRNSADFWSALDNQLKPSINYVVTIPVDVDVTISAPEVKTKVFAFRGGNDQTPEAVIQISGLLHRKGKPEEGIPKALLFAKELGITAVTDEAGNFAFRKMQAGSHTLEISVPGEKKRTVPLEIPKPNYDIAV